MFEGEKTWIFWVGVVMLAVASWYLFYLLWEWANYHGYSEYLFSYVRGIVPYLVGAAIFILVGMYMMKSGVKKKEQSTDRKIQLVSFNQ